MAKVISGFVSADGKIYDGEGFTVEVHDYGYRITFNTLSRIPNVVAQPWKDPGAGAAISCQTLDQRPSPVTVTMQTLDERGDFRRNSFNFVAVSNE